MCVQLGVVKQKRGLLFDNIGHLCVVQTVLIWSPTTHMLGVKPWLQLHVMILLPSMVCRAECHVRLHQVFLTFEMLPTSYSLIQMSRQLAEYLAQLPSGRVEPHVELVQENMSRATADCL